MMLCVFCSPKSSTVVLASFCRVLCKFPLSHFGHPPNMVTWVHPGPKLKAVAVWYIRGCAPSGRVSWEEGESWVDIDKLLKEVDWVFITCVTWSHHGSIDKFWDPAGIRTKTDMYIGTTVLRYTFLSLLPHLTLLFGQGRRGQFA